MRTLLAGSWWLIAVSLVGCNDERRGIDYTTPSAASRAALERGLQAFDLQKMGEARAAFEEAVSSDPGFAIARAYLAISMNFTGDVAGQWAAGESALERASDVETHLFAALSAWGRQSYEEARDAMLEVIAREPNSRRAYFELGWLHHKIGDHRDAIRVLERALELDDTYAAAEILRARALHASGDLDGAERAIDRAVSIDEGSPLAHSVRADILRTGGRSEQALEAYARAVSLEDGFVPALFGRAATLREQARYDSSVRAYRELCDTTQRLADGAYKELFLDWTKAEDVCFDYGMTYLLAGDLDQAAGIFEATASYAYETRLENAPIFQNALARLYLESGDLDRAEATYDRGLKVSQETSHSPLMRNLWDGRYLHAKARIRARQGRLTEAFELAARMRSMIDEAGDDGERFLPAYHYLMGYLHVEAEDFSRAEEHLRQSRLSDPFNSWLLARASAGRGDAVRARSLMEELVAMTPGSYGHALVVEKARRWLSSHSETSDKELSPPR